MVEEVVWIVKQAFPNEWDEGGFDSGVLELASQFSGIEYGPKRRHRSAAAFWFGLCPTGYNYKAVFFFLFQFTLLMGFIYLFNPKILKNFQ